MSDYRFAKKVYVVIENGNNFDPRVVSVYADRKVAEEYYCNRDFFTIVEVCYNDYTSHCNSCGNISNKMV